MAVLERQHLDLKIDELTASVTEYMNEEAFKKDGEKTGLNTTKNVTSPLPHTPINVAEASTPPGTIGETPHSLLLENPTEAALLIDLHPRECTIIFFCKRCMPSFETSSHCH